MKFLYDAVPAEKRGGYAADSAALAQDVARDVRPGDAVLVKGSLGSRMRVVIAALSALGDSIGAAT
jgi:UDP-N-acetylmuramoyl-tripeptide--D-alanyl-D-alanine ligase